jgi:haloacetate dehalogenase
MATHFPDGFRGLDVDVSMGRIHGVIGGSGPPVLLLHGVPETHLMWRDVAPALAERHTVIATDLRGYGDSAAPPATTEHPYTMRSLATDQAEVMTALGFERFAVAGHDRGARCAYRLAVDHPERVERLAVLDVVPTGDAYDRANADFSLDHWVWSFLAAPTPVPEMLILGAPDTLVDHMLRSWAGERFTVPADVRARYVAQFSDPSRVHAICEQYRAAARIDADLDRQDRPRRPIVCPTLVLWSGQGAVEA